MTLATDIEPQDAPEPPLRSPGPKPLLLSRHHFKNDIELFHDLVRRVYVAEDVELLQVLATETTERQSGVFRPTTNRTARFAGVAAAERSQR
jgi:hypothetical protein